MRKDDHVATSVRLPRELVDRLDAFCDDRIVGRNLVVIKALERLLDEQQPLNPIPDGRPA